MATPPIPQVFEEWGKLEKLNKERDLVGIYLSAHPLDDYAIILNSVCTTRMKELSEKERWLNQDITFGGIVTNVRNGVGKSGQPFGIVTIEDYSGAGELPLWGKDWSTWMNFMTVGNSIYVSAHVEQAKHNANRIDISVGKVEYLIDVKDNLIHNITITIPLTSMDEDIVEELTQHIEGHPGSTELYFHIPDPEGQMPLTLHSRNHRITVQRSLIEFIDRHDELSYHINMQ